MKSKLFQTVQTHEIGQNPLLIRVGDQDAIRISGVLRPEIVRVFILGGIHADTDGNLSLIFSPGNGVKFSCADRVARLPWPSIAAALLATVAALLVSVTILHEINLMRAETAQKVIAE